MEKILRIGTRPSSLALKQAEEIKKIFSGLPAARLASFRGRSGRRGPAGGGEFKVIPILTMGDKDKITPLDKVEIPDFFTREIDNALLSGEIDLAVHSSKDLAERLTDGLAVIFETESLSPYDALVSRENLKLKELLQGSRIGVSSQRRKEQIRRLRTDLTMVDIRGNIKERVCLIDEGKVDAVVVAHAALIRLGLEARLAEVFSLDFFPTHPKQGKLAVVSRENDKDIISLFKS